MLRGPPAVTLAPPLKVIEPVPVSLIVIEPDGALTELLNTVLPTVEIEIAGALVLTLVELEIIAVPKVVGPALTIFTMPVAASLLDPLAVLIVVAPVLLLLMFIT